MRLGVFWHLLAVSSLVLLGSACGSNGSDGSDDRDGPPPNFEFVQLSDIHIGKSLLQEQENLHQAVSQINQMELGFVLLTGDLTNSGKVEEYAALKSVLSELAVPYYCVPGDNDVLDGEGDLERYQDELGPDYFSFAYQGYRFLGLNNGVETSLDPEQRQWLEQELQKGEAAIAFGHKALVYRTGEPLGNAESLLRLFDTYDVFLYLNGDEHESEEIGFHGTQHVWCDNLSYFQSGVETYNLYTVYSSRVDLSHVHWDRSQELIRSFPIEGTGEP